PEDYDPDVMPGEASPEEERLSGATGSRTGAAPRPEASAPGTPYPAPSTNDPDAAIPIARKTAPKTSAPRPKAPPYSPPPTGHNPIIPERQPIPPAGLSGTFARKNAFSNRAQNSP